MIRALVVMVIIWSNRPVEYSSRIFRWFFASSPSKTSSCLLFASARNSASRNVQIMSHGDMKTLIARHPAIALITKWMEIVRMSMRIMFFR